MLLLTRAMIRNMASSDVVYSRGLRHFKDNDIKSASYSKNQGQYKIVIEDVFRYMVTITQTPDGGFEYTCNCPTHLKEKGACRHVVAALFKILRHQENSARREMDPAENRTMMVLDYFSNQEDEILEKQIYHIEPIITVRSILGEEGIYANLAIRVGNVKMYKVASLKRFISEHIDKQNIVLGKDFKFIYNESEYDRSSMELLDFIISVHEVQEMIDSQHSTAMFQKSQLLLTRQLLIKVLELLSTYKITCELCLYDKNYFNVKTFRENPNIRYDLDVVEDAIVLDYRDKDAVIPLSKNGDIIYYNGAVFIPNERFKRNYVPLFNMLGPNRGPLIFRGEKKQRFLEEVLPRLSDSMDMDVPEELADRYLKYDCQSSIYFDRYKDGIKADLRFRYGEVEFGCFENPRLDFYILVRQRETEEKVMLALEQLGFEAKSSFYYLKNETSIYEFLLSERKELGGLADLYYSEDFKRLKIKSYGAIRINLRVSSAMDLLEMNFDMDNIAEGELSELFRSLRVKKKYYRLKDGSFVDLLDDDMQKLSGVLENLGISSRDMGGNSIALSKSSAFYLQDAFSDTHFIVDRNEEFKKLIEQITSVEKLDFELPDGIAAELREYQKSGYRWLRTLSENSLGGILADDMGLGKTLQAIVYMKSYAAPEQTFLVVCPSSIIYNWLDELDNFAPSLKTLVVTGTPAERQEFIASHDNYDVLITSYPLMRRDVMHYRRIDFHTIFLDEAQFIKNAASLNAQSVKLLCAKHRFALTGTPIENALSELWSIFDFIMPNFLLSHTKFAGRYEKPIMKGDGEMLKSLNQRIRPFILRRMKKDVLKELPGKIEEKMVTEMTDEQKRVYLSYMNNIRSDLFGEIEKTGIEKSQLKILAALTRLRQICCHPSTFIQNYNGGSGKMDLLLQLIDNALANEHRILLFSQFTSMLSIIGEELSRKNIDFFCLQGSTPIEERMDHVRQFNSGVGQIFLVSLKAGGTGLNLIGADTVIHYDPWWNPAVEEQATDRAYRIGQKNNVYVLRLLTRGTIEEKIYKLQQKKKELSDSIIQSKEVFINRLSREELEDIFTFEG